MSKARFSLLRDLLDRAAADIDVVWGALAEDPADPRESYIALRFMGAVHRLVLEGKAPELASFYPSTGGNPKGRYLWEVFRGTVVDHTAELARSARNPVQTNEVGRSGLWSADFSWWPAAPALR